jgi:hypothetical protein
MEQQQQQQQPAWPTHKHHAWPIEEKNLNFFPHGGGILRGQDFGYDRKFKSIYINFKLQTVNVPGQTFHRGPRKMRPVVVIVGAKVQSLPRRRAPNKKDLIGASAVRDSSSLLCHLPAASFAVAHPQTKSDPLALELSI